MTLSHTLPRTSFALGLVAGLLATCGSTDALAATAATPRARPALPIPTPMVGVTTDAIDHISDIVASLQNLAKVATTRIVFDEKVPASSYRDAAVKIRAVSYVMGEILDSFYVKTYTVQQYLSRTTEYLDALGDVVDIWEVGNEINGEWLGNNADVVAKMTGAYDLVKARGKTAELTLYYNKNCWSKSSNEMFTWAQNNIPQRMKDGLDYVMVSYYEDDCNNLQPDWPTVFHQLQAMFPRAKIGFGETGTLKAAKKAEYINRYYALNINEPGYVGGYFWWYFKQDMVPSTKPLFATLNGAIGRMPASPKTGAVATASPLGATAPIPATPQAVQPAAPATAAPASPTTGAQTIATTSTAWNTAYDGYGSVRYDATSGITLAPSAATQADQTHAALTLAKLPAMRDFHATITASTDRQLRQNSPANPWETFWIFFNYNPVKNTKTTNYFLLKPNGVELGTATGQNGQAYLQTGPSTAQAIGATNRFDIDKVGNHVKIAINGVPAVDFTGALIDVAGSLGLYAEDAQVRVTSVQVTPL